VGGPQVASEESIRRLIVAGQVGANWRAFLCVWRVDQVARARQKANNLQFASPIWLPIWPQFAPKSRQTLSNFAKLCQTLPTFTQRHSNGWQDYSTVLASNQ